MLNCLRNVVPRIFSCCGEELSIGTTSQVVKHLSKVLGFNVLDTMNESTSDPRSFLPEDTFLENLNEIINRIKKEGKKSKRHQSQVGKKILLREVNAMS